LPRIYTQDMEENVVLASNVYNAWEEIEHINFTLEESSLIDAFSILELIPGDYITTQLVTFSIAIYKDNQLYHQGPQRELPIVNNELLYLDFSIDARKICPPGNYIVVAYIYYWTFTTTTSEYSINK
ncbi:MAG: hypothetical protein L3J74_02965, partial [Bacteroidales bacterium]|nr:hypothetical protein [Bacteroidales bacterium]